MLSRTTRVRCRVAAFAGAFALVLATCAPRAMPSEQSVSSDTVTPVKPGSPETPGLPSTPLATNAPPTANTAAVSGEFEIENTTPGGGQVQLDTLAVHLERSSGAEATWTRLPAPCETDPKAPVSFDDQLIVHYECVRGADGIPADFRLRAVVEATIAGSNEAFRLESEVKR